MCEIFAGAYFDAYDSSQRAILPFVCFIHIKIQLKINLYNFC